MISDTLRLSVAENVSTALAEDIGSGDLTAELIAADVLARATVSTREAVVLAGQPWFDEVFRQIDDRISIHWDYKDGDRVPAGASLCTLEGAARSILSGERSALNFLQTLSATATTTARYVAAVAETKAVILDTRKTLPGLRLAQKYAVRCGGGSNHRIGLYDAILIKENHIESCGGIAAAVDAARRLRTGMPVEVEVESIDEMRAALAVKAERLLLDNFDISLLEQAVAINRAEGKPPAVLEASGNMTIDAIRAVAQTGIDFISVGALTKNIRAIDLSMRFD